MADEQRISGPLQVHLDDPGDQIRITFKQGIISREEWCAPNAIISLAPDGSAIELTILWYRTNRQWLFDENFVGKYHLEDRLDDLRLVYARFFAPASFGTKTISFEGPDGEEHVIYAQDPEKNING